jgi:hypothetical protein
MHSHAAKAELALAGNEQLPLSPWATVRATHLVVEAAVC